MDAHDAQPRGDSIASMWEWCPTMPHAYVKSGGATMVTPCSVAISVPAFPRANSLRAGTTSYLVGPGRFTHSAPYQHKTLCLSFRRDVLQIPITWVLNCRWLHEILAACALAQPGATKHLTGYSSRYIISWTDAIAATTTPDSHVCQHDAAPRDASSHVYICLFSDTSSGLPQYQPHRSGRS